MHKSRYRPLDCHYGAEDHTGTAILIYQYCRGSWFAFRYPKSAYINMFVKIVKTPDATSAALGLARIKACPGNSGQIDFVTLSEI